VPTLLILVDFADRFRCLVLLDRLNELDKLDRKQWIERTDLHDNVINLFDEELNTMRLAETTDAIQRLSIRPLKWLQSRPLRACWI
jgi:hypothetical protein